VRELRFGLEARQMTRSRLFLSALTLAALSAGLARAEQPVDVELAASRPVVVYGERLRLIGTVPREAAGRVGILERPFGEGGFAALATVSTDAAGRFRYAVRPRLETTYRATSSDARIADVTVRVRPRVTVRVRGGAILTSVTAGRSLIGRVVILQRRTRDRWVAIKRAVLRRRLQRVRARLPEGTSRLRIVIPRRQAGPGYLAGVSRVLRVRD
jgi:hypothetical protein